MSDVSGFVDVEVDVDEESMDQMPSLDSESAVFEDDAMLQECVEYLCREYDEAEAEREAGNRYKDWAQWRRNLECEPKETQKNTPYRNASNVVTPLTQTLVHTGYAYMKQMFDVKNPLWTVRALRTSEKEDVARAEFLTRYLNILANSRSDLYAEKIKSDLFNEISIMGTAGIKVMWQSHSKKNTYIDNDGVRKDRQVWLHRGPKVEITPVERFLWPSDASDAESAPWIAREISLPWHELSNREANGIYTDVAALKGWAEHGMNKYHESERIQRQLERGHADMYDITEFSVYWDVDGDGQYEDIIIVLHIPSKTVLRVEFNPIIARDFLVAQFIKRTFAVEGRGIGQITAHLQEESSGIHNLRNDNMKFSAMRMLAMKRSTAQSNKESIYAGKIFVTDDPRGDIQPITMGEVPPSSLQAEQNAMQMAREASGISSTMGGFSDPRLGSRDTFRGQQMRQTQATNVFSSILTSAKEVFSEMGQLILYQMVAHKDEVMEKEQQAQRLTEEEMQMLEQILSLPLEELPIRLGFTVNTTDIEQSFESKRQNLMTMTQLFAQWSQQTTPIAMQLFTPQGKELQEAAPELYKHMLSTYMGATRMLHEVFEFFDEDDPSKYLPDVERYQLLKSIMDEMDSDLIKQKKMVLQELRLKHEAQAGMQEQQAQGMQQAAPMDAGFEAE